MSDLIVALWQAKASEVERLRQAYEEASYLAIPANLTRDLEMTGTPTTVNEIDVENLVLDPLGRSGEWQSIWFAAGGALSQVDISDLPRFPYAVQASASGGEDLLLYAVFAPDVGGVHHWQAYVKSDWLSPENEVRIRQAFSPYDVLGEPVVLGEGEVPASITGWTRVGGAVTLPIPATTMTEEQTLPVAKLKVVSTTGFPPSGELTVSGQTVAYTGIEAKAFTGCTEGEGALPEGTAVAAATPGQHRLEFSLHKPEAAKMAYMTAPTAVAGSFARFRNDPEGTPDPEPFTGDLATTDQYTYDWAGARHSSRSRRYGRHFNLLAQREREAGFSVDPVGMSHAQRATYVLSRWQARHRPWAETFTRLIAIVIQSGTGADLESIEENLRVVEDIPSYSFTVEVPYSPSGVLAERIRKLVADIHPAHLNINLDTAIIWGSFEADISKAGDPV